MCGRPHVAFVDGGIPVTRGAALRAAEVYLRDIAM
jgi:hypothetical protein